jgi:hypothetical protein
MLTAYMREQHIRVAKVDQAELSRRRILASWKDFYWVVFDWAQNARRLAAACKQEPGKAISSGAQK